MLYTAPGAEATMPFCVFVTLVVVGGGWGINTELLAYFSGLQLSPCAASSYKKKINNARTNTHIHTIPAHTVHMCNYVDSSNKNNYYLHAQSLSPFLPSPEVLNSRWYLSVFFLSLFVR